MAIRLPRFRSNDHGNIVLKNTIMPKSNSDVQRFADLARDSADWPSAAFFYRQVLNRRPEDVGLWLQYGNMLKESGLFVLARHSYNEAIRLGPTDPEPVLQLAILSKIQGKMTEAAQLYERSMQLGYPDQSFIQRELGFLRRSNPSPAHVNEDNTFIIYLSSASMPVAEDDTTKLKHYLGVAHYSYGFVLSGYKEALETAGFRCQVISRPEYLPDIRKQSSVQALHIGFYPPDGPRFLKGAYNVTCVAWEFERLRSRAEAKSYHAFSDAASMLSRAQEVWALSEFGAEAVRRSSGINLVRAVPTPVRARRKDGRSGRPTFDSLQKAAVQLERISWVPLAVFPSIQIAAGGHALARRNSLLNWLIEADEEQSLTIFICVFNVHDFRKQIKPMVQAFLQFAQKIPNAFLLLKVSCIDSDKLDVNSMMFMEQISDPGEMTAPLVSRQILMTTEALSRHEMETLNDLASYYICTSHAEGQNLPLIEAMGAGVVPVSVDHTAMRDYISRQNAIIIPSKLQPLSPRLTGRYEMYDINTYYVDGRSVYDALEQAAAQSNSEYATMSGEAVTSVTQRFSSSTFLTAFDHSLGLLKAEVKA